MKTATAAGLYFIDGIKQQGDAFRKAIAELSRDTPDVVCVEREDGFLLSVTNFYSTADHVGLDFMLTEPNGTTWSYQEIGSLEDVLERVERFLNESPCWDNDLARKQTTPSDRESLIRFLRFLVIAAILTATAIFVLKAIL